jgi:hypothetical protein
MGLIRNLLILSYLLSAATYAADAEKYIGIFDASVGETGHLNLMLRQVEVSTSGKIQRNQINEPIAMRLEGLNNPIEFISNEVLNLSEELKKANRNGALTLICLGCSSNIPTEIQNRYEMYSSYTLTHSIADIKMKIANFKKDIEDRAAVHDRAIKQAKADAAAWKKEEEKRRIAFLERHHRKCLSFGFKANTEGYAQCRLKLELAEQQSERDATFAEAEERRRQADNKVRAEKIKRDEDESRRYNQAQLAEQKRQRDAAAGLALMQMGSGLVNPPKPPPPANQTIVTPSGRIVNCNTVGTVTNCF